MPRHSFPPLASASGADVARHRSRPADAAPRPGIRRCGGGRPSLLECGEGDSQGFVHLNPEWWTREGVCARLARRLITPMKPVVGTG